MATIQTSRGARAIKYQTFRLRAGDVMRAGSGTTLNPTKQNVRAHLFTIPADSLITTCTARVVTAFNDTNSSHTIDVGTSAVQNNLLAALNLKAINSIASTGVLINTITTAATPIYMKCTAGGAVPNATTGEIVIVVGYVEIGRVDEVTTLGSDTEVDAAQQ